MKLPANTQLGAVKLTVSDLQRSTDFYQQSLGFQIHQQVGNIAHLGAGKHDILILEEDRHAKPVQPARGLYHFAVLVPSRFELAQVLKNIAETQTPVSGFADHFVSEAIYLPDPDGHGIEIYRDQPRERWAYINGQMQIGTEALDVQALLNEALVADQKWDGLHADTVMGHMHFHVTDLSAGEHFYNEVLGFDHIIEIARFMSFQSVGGYHHHIGIRVARGLPDPDSLRMHWFRIALPDEESLQAVLERVKAANISVEKREDGYYLQDPSQNGVVLRSEL